MRGSRVFRLFDLAARNWLGILRGDDVTTDLELLIVCYRFRYQIPILLWYEVNILY